MQADIIMRSFNRNAYGGWDGRQYVFIEDVYDPDGRPYRIEYRCDANGRKATAWALYKPWHGQGGFSYAQGHLSDDGFICLGSHATKNNSPYTLEYVIKRARFWCVGYSYLREHGYAATKRDIAEW